MTDEELLIARIELYKRGYRAFYRFGQGGGTWTLRARRTPPWAVNGYNEQPIEVRTPEELAATLARLDAS